MRPMLEAKTDAAPALRCAECGIQAEDDASDWKAYIGGGFEGEPLEVAVFCPTCTAVEFGE
jgi:hypothetical protein